MQRPFHEAGKAIRPLYEYLKILIQCAGTAFSLNHHKSTANLFRSLQGYGKSFRHLRWYSNFFDQCEDSEFFFIGKIEMFSLHIKTCLRSTNLLVKRVFYKKCVRLCLPAVYVSQVKVFHKCLIAESKLQFNSSKV